MARLGGLGVRAFTPQPHNPTFVAAAAATAVAVTLLLLVLLLSPCCHPLQMRKAANRLNFDFNKAEDEYIDGDEIVGLGTINKEGSGRLRLVASQQKVTGRGGRGGGRGWMGQH